MNWLSKLTPLVAILALTAACGDDDDDDEATGGNAGNGGGGGPTQCVGAYEMLTAAQLEAATTSGECAEDTLAICTNDVSFEAGDCGVDCLGEDTEDAQLACTLECIEGRVDPDPSSGCLGCYIAAVACARENCLSPCASDPTSAACVDCREEMGCTGTFFTCSGLPGGGSGAGGAGSQ